MRRSRWYAVVVLALLGCATAPAPLVVKTIDFKVELARQGEWIVVAPYGRVWHPNTQQVGANFVPYLTNGGWAHGADGWTFETDWKPGQFVFHYGRWFVADDLGWLWWPDQTRGTAWVQWRGGDGYVGWSPLPPEVRAARATPAPWLYTKAKYLSARDATPFQLKPEEMVRMSGITEALPASGPDAQLVASLGGLERDPQLPVIAPPEPPPEPPKEEEAPPAPAPKKKVKVKKKH